MGVVSPGRRTFLYRSSRGSIPIFSASSSMSTSEANSLWGEPKALNAEPQAWFVQTVRPSPRIFGHHVASADVLGARVW